MVGKRTISSSLAVLLLGCVLSPWAQSAQFFFAATDVADVTQGEDLWRYSYEISDVTFGANEGFTISLIGAFIEAWRTRHRS